VGGEVRIFGVHNNNKQTNKQTRLLYLEGLAVWHNNKKNKNLKKGKCACVSLQVSKKKGGGGWERECETERRFGKTTVSPRARCRHHCIRLLTARSLYGGKVAGLIWIRFAAEALQFSFAKSSRPPLKMWKCKVKLTIISRFKLFQVFATQKSGIHGPLSEVVHGNRGALTSTKSLNVC